MKFLVLEDFQAKRGVITAGQLVSLSEGAAAILINERKVIPADAETRHAYEERAAVMEFDGRLDSEDAERHAWCRTVCMLFLPSQWGACERFKGKSCLKKKAIKMELLTGQSPIQS